MDTIKKRLEKAEKRAKPILKKYSKNDVFKNLDNAGRLLTYQILDWSKPELQPSGIMKEFNTLKELNKFLKNQ